MKKPRYTDQQIAQALRQAEQGTAVAELCRRLGVSETTLYHWIRPCSRTSSKKRPEARPAARDGRISCGGVSGAHAVGVWRRPVQPGDVLRPVPAARRDPRCGCACGSWPRPVRGMTHGA